MSTLHLTEIAVRALKTPGTYYDASTPAFGIRVGKRRKTWFVIRGKERLRTTIGRFPEIPLADARKWATSEVQLHRLIRDFAHPELCGPERSYQFRVEQWDKTERAFSEEPSAAATRWRVSTSCWPRPN
jgi:Arm DNA-binding domain